MGSLDGRYILLVEDDYYLATDASEWLAEAGACVVGPASSSGQALAMLNGQPVDAAVLDINLGTGPDFAVAQRLCVMNVPVVFATGYDETVDPDYFRPLKRREKAFCRRQFMHALEEVISR